MSLVAALYVDRLGPYPKLLGPEMCWDEARDARTYAGPWPVIAHPPCGAWGALRYMRVPNRERRTEEAGCGPRAAQQVREFGGVLEQPAGSKLWDFCKIPPPLEDNPFGLPLRDGCNGFSIQVEQVAWGHVARKKTWLYFVGIERQRVNETCRWGTGKPTHWVSGGRKHDRKGKGGVVPPGIKVCSAQQRRRTPIAFAEWLIALASTVEMRPPQLPTRDPHRGKARDE